MRWAKIGELPDVPRASTRQAAAVRIHISVDRSDPPAGTASAEGGQPQAYEGWLGLMGVLSDLVGDPGAREAGTLDGNSGSDTTMREEGPDG